MEIKQKLILLHTGLCDERIKSSQDIFLRHECPVNSCVISNKMKDIYDDDLVISQRGVIGNILTNYFSGRDSDQIVAWFIIESSQNIRTAGTVNWTLTYRQDSTINTPYYKYKPYDNINMTRKPMMGPLPTAPAMQTYAANI